jgi:hypothetical protein
MAKINNSSFQVFNLEKLYFLINEFIRQKSEQQNNISPTYDLSFLLPFIVSGDDDPEDWSEDKVQKFVETVKKAGEEISADDVPNNSPAGEYRSKIYNKVKEGLQETVKVYKTKQGENSQRVWAICDFLLFSLGWNDKDQVIDQNEPSLSRRLSSAEGKIKFIEEFYFENNGSQNPNYGWADALSDANKKADKRLYKNESSFYNARRNLRGRKAK